MLCHNIYIITYSEYSILKVLQSYQTYQSFSDSTTIRQPYAKYQTMTSCSINYKAYRGQRAITDLFTMIQNGRKNGSLVANQAFGLFATPFSHYICIYVLEQILYSSIHNVCIEKA